MIENVQEQAITFETALKVADESVFAKHKRHLKNIEVAVLRGALQGQKYDQIAAECDYAPEYIKHDVGPKLWQILSSSLGEKVSKTNLMAVLAQRASEKFKIQNFTLSAVEGSKFKNEESSSFYSRQSSISNPQSPELELPIGLIPLDSVLYVERPPVESRCYEEITRSGALIRIKALLARIANPTWVISLGKINSWGVGDQFLASIGLGSFC